MLAKNTTEDQEKAGKSKKIEPQHQIQFFLDFFFKNHKMEREQGKEAEKELELVSIHLNAFRHFHKKKREEDQMKARTLIFNTILIFRTKNAESKEKTAEKGMRLLVEKYESKYKNSNLLDENKSGSEEEKKAGNRNQNLEPRTRKERSRPENRERIEKVKKRQRICTMNKLELREE